MFFNVMYSQCFGTSQYPPNPVDATNTWSDISNCNYAGEYAIVNVLNGNTYQFSTCSSNGSTISYDTELRLTDMTGNLLASNNDYCNTQSFISWQSNFSGQVKIHLTQYLCQSNQICSNIRVRTFGPPTNDDCSNAITLPVYGASCGSATQGTVEGVLINGAIPFGGCGGTDNGDVWYKFIATSTSHNINLNCSQNFDGVIELRTGCPGSSSLILCKNGFTGGGNTETMLAGNLTVGNTYYIRIYNYNGINTGSYTFDICITTNGSPLLNDNCNGAELLTAQLNCNSPLTVSTLGASSVVENICGSPATVDLWYYFIASASTQNITVTPSSSFDPVIELKSSTSFCSNWTNLFCQDANGIGIAETLNATNLIVGNTYYVRIAHYGSSSPSTSTYNLCLTTIGPQNDDCASAIEIPVFQGEFCNQTTPVNLFGATQTLPDNCSGFPNAQDVWFKFNAQNTSHIITSNYGTGIYPVIEVRTGSCNGVSIDCGLGQSGINQILINNLTIGQNYFIRLYHGQGGTAQTNYLTDLCITTPNDASIYEDTIESNLIVYPIPSQDIIKINNQEFLSSFEYQIINISGYIEAQGVINSNSEINIKNLEEGVYILKLNNNIFRHFIKAIN